MGELVWVGAAAVVAAAAGWFFWPYVTRSDHRRGWRSDARQDRRTSGRSIVLARRPGFTIDRPARAERLDTFGLLLDYHPSREFRFREPHGAFSEPVPGSESDRRTWQDAARDYLDAMAAADDGLLTDYERTIGSLRALLPGGRRSLSARRAKARERYAARVHAAESAYRPVHDPLARRHDTWVKQRTRQREEYERERAEQYARAKALAAKEAWGYEVSRSGKRITVRLFRTDADHSGSRSADRAAPHRNLTPSALAAELEPHWRAAGMIAGPALPGAGIKGYLLSSTADLPPRPSGSSAEVATLRWERGVRASVEKATGLRFAEWWLLATGYRLLEGADLTRHVERQHRHFHAPYSSGYGTF